MPDEPAPPVRPTTIIDLRLRHGGETFGQRKLSAPPEAEFPPDLSPEAPEELEEEEAPRAPTRRLVAVVLSLVIPGAGHFLYGRWFRGSLWLLAFPVVVETTFFLPPTNFGAFQDLVLGGIIRLASALDVWTLRVVPARFPGRRAILAAALVLLVLCVVWLSEWNRFSTYRHVGAAMEETAQAKDDFLVDGGAYSRPALAARLATNFLLDDLVDTRPHVHGRPERGNLVIYLYPRRVNRAHLLRVAAVGGDTIQMRGAYAVVNGRPLAEPYVGAAVAKELADGDCKHFYACTPFTVPPDSYFLLGDNRATGQDSRYFGPIPIEKILGKPLVINWSTDDGGQLRRWRLGLIPK